MDNLILLLAQTTEKINWADEVFKKWLASGDEAYLFLILVVISLLAIVSALVFLFKLYIGEKDSKYKALSDMEKEVEKEKEKIRVDNKIEINKWIDKWSKDKEEKDKGIIEYIKKNTQAWEDVLKELELWREIHKSQCKGGKNNE